MRLFFFLVLFFASFAQARVIEEKIPGRYAIQNKHLVVLDKNNQVMNDYGWYYKSSKSYDKTWEICSQKLGREMAFAKDEKGIIFEAFKTIMVDSSPTPISFELNQNNDGVVTGYYCIGHDIDDRINFKFVNFESCLLAEGNLRYLINYFMCVPHEQSDLLADELSQNKQEVNPQIKAKIDKLIADLSDKKYQIRKAAKKELMKMDDGAIPYLMTVDKKSLSIEQRNQIESLIARYIETDIPINEDEKLEM